MTALTDALRASQAQAIAALSKAYIVELVDHNALLEKLDALGATNKVEQGQLVSALTILRTLGDQAPEAARPDTSHEPATDKQMNYAAKLANERGVILPDYALTKANASKLIEQLQANAYNSDEWTVPF